MSLNDLVKMRRKMLEMKTTTLLLHSSSILKREKRNAQEV